MIETLYLVLVAAALLGFVMIMVNDPKKIIPAIGLPAFLAMLLIFLAVASFNVEKTFCFQATMNSTATISGNVTSTDYGTGSVCHTEQTADHAMGWLFIGLTFFMALIIVLRAFKALGGAYDEEGSA